MPINRKWDLKKLLVAARSFPLRSRERLTFEYVCSARQRLDREGARSCEVAARPSRQGQPDRFEPGPGFPYGTPSEAAVTAFQRVLMEWSAPVLFDVPAGEISMRPAAS